MEGPATQMHDLNRFKNVYYRKKNRDSAGFG